MKDVPPYGFNIHRYLSQCAQAKKAMQEAERRLNEQYPGRIEWVGDEAIIHEQALEDFK